MTRALTSQMVAAFKADACTPILFFHGVFSGGQHLRLWTGLGDITFDSQTWLGNGWFTGISGGDEADDISAQSLTVELSGIPESILGIILNAAQGALGEVFIGALDEDGALIPDPYLVFSGKMDTATIKESADGAYIDLTYETRLVDLDRANDFRYTQESQKIFWPNDRGFEYVVAANKITLFWGNKKKRNDRKRKRDKQKKKNTR